ncbi:MAG: thiolase family protein, partial [Alphaproteobacteria bacterium]|nr:thiolase family protein [Alphaproteobacteria bacterium]
MARASRAAIVGAAATPVGRLAPRPGEAVNAFEHDVLLDVVREALASAGIGADQIDSAVFTLPPGNTPQLGFATFFCSQLGLKLTGQIAEVVEMGITGGLAFDQACADVQLGRAEFALALGVSFQTATPRAEAMEQSIRVVGDIDFQAPFGVTPISWYALDAARYMHETGALREDLAAVAVKSRRHARDNSLAQFRGPLSVEDVIAARPIVEPLGLLDVPAVADGAVCLIVAGEDAARKLGVPFVTVAGRGFYHEGYHQIGDVPADITAFPAANISANNALSAATIGLGDLDLVEIYAPCTITEILVTEALGICARGQGGSAARDGLTALGGDLPVNTSGGCLARGHPPSLTALYGLLEIYEQLLDRSGSRQVANA